jgi:hypothetical protein
LAGAGCSANEIMAISGHATMKELIRYTKAADQARLARNAMTRTAKSLQLSDVGEFSLEPDKRNALTVTAI